MPALAPGRFADQLLNWPRESLALCALGVTGWSMRIAIAELLSAKLGDVQPNAGSLRRLWANLARRGFWQRREGGHQLGCGQKPAYGSAWRGRRGCDDPDPGPADRPGKRYLRACGVQAVPSEWDRLCEVHGGASQTAMPAGLHLHVSCPAAGLCYRRSVPEVAGPAAPDARWRTPTRASTSKSRTKAGAANAGCASGEPGGVARPCGHRRRHAGVTHEPGQRSPGRRRRARRRDRSPNPVCEPGDRGAAVGAGVVRRQAEVEDCGAAAEGETTA